MYIGPRFEIETLSMPVSGGQGSSCLRLRLRSSVEHCIKQVPDAVRQSSSKACNDEIFEAGRETVPSTGPSLDGANRQ